MPTRNIVTIGLTILVCLACYSIASRNRYAGVFSEAMRIVEREALREVPRRQLFESAMDGMVKALDANSQFISQEQRPALEEGLNQEFVGVGLHFVLDDEGRGFRVVAPMPGKPAWKAGIRPDDIIVSVDGAATAGMSNAEAIQRIRGPKGETVELGIIRDAAEEPLTIAIIRDDIPIDSVIGDSQNPDGSWNFFLEGDPRAGYIRLTEFGRKSSDEMESALASIDGQIDFLILDLRDNPGGLLDAAIRVSDMFIGREVPIVETRDRNQTVLSREYATSKTAFDLNTPIYVLINARSASAAEIVSACLQDHGRAIVVGEQSYGKGTVQDLISLEPNKSMLRLTTSSYWRPSGRNIDRTVLEHADGDYGVHPDEGFVVELSDELRDDIGIARLRRDTELIGLVKTDSAEEQRIESYRAWLDADITLQRALEAARNKIRGNRAA